MRPRSSNPVVKESADARPPAQPPSLGRQGAESYRPVHPCGYVDSKLQAKHEGPSTTFHFLDSAAFYGRCNVEIGVRQ